MMNVHTGHTLAMRAVLGCAAAVMATPMLSAAGPARAAGGTITFVGSIVGPQFDIRTAAASARPAARAGAPVVAGTGSAMTVTFSAPHADVPGAAVAFYSNDAARSTVGPGPRDDVATRFVDPQGRPFAWQPSGYYHLQPRGGVLSLSVRHTGASSAPKPITIVVSYD
jgi:hypothetical protein